VVAFQRILCPIDFSETSTRALACAAAIARWYGGRLALLHVVPVFDDNMESSFPWKGDHPRTPYAPVRADVLADMRRSIAEADATALGPDVMTEEGRTHVLIVERARDADLLVLGTHGRGGFDRLLLGSVTEKVIRTAHCPVLTVSPSASPNAVTQTPFKRIVCPVDFSSSSLRALDYALDLAGQADGCVTILHALDYMDAEEPCEHVDAAVRQGRQHIIDDARERVHAVAAQRDATWCRIEEQVVIGRAYRAMLGYATTHRADLIVMGAQGRGGLDLMLYGSNTHHVVRGAACPVLTLRA